MTTQDIVQKLWNLCDVLRDDGINYSDYVTELVLLLFIKMEFENAESGLLQKHRLPAYARWPELRDKSGLNLLRHYRETLLKLSASEARMVRPGAVFVSCIGNLGKVGVAGLPMAFNQQINAVEFDSGVVTDRFGYFTCMTLGPWLLENSSATTISIVNKGRFEQVEINVPPLNEQAEIVRRVETLFAFADRLEARLQTAQTAADRLTPSLLVKAFRGELVPQDPNDEPASELLMRLAKQEPTSNTKRPGRKVKST